MDESSISYLTLVLAKKYAKNYVDSEISKILSFEIEIVETLPDEPDNHTIYLVPKDPGTPTNGYFEYIYVNNKWEIIGDTDVDLSDYYTKTEVDQLIEDSQYVLPTATADTLGGIKVDTNSLQIDENGVMSVDSGNVEDIIEEVVQPIGNDDISSLFN